MSPKLAPKTFSVCRIHLIGGQKGGVGKSFLARVLYQCFLDSKHSAIAFDADAGDTPDFFNAYSDSVRKTEFVDDVDRNTKANVIFNAALNRKNDVVVNLPSRVARPLFSWLETNDLPALALENQIQFIHWFVCSGEHDSVMPLVKSLERIGGAVPHVVVKNLRFTEWDYFENHAPLQSLINRQNCNVLELPRLQTAISSKILEQKTSFRMAASSSDFDLIQRNAISKYLRSVYPILESTNFLPHG